MRSLSRVAVLGTLAAIAVAPSAMAANSGTASLSPKKGGTDVVGAPTTIKISTKTPDTPSTSDGGTRLLALQAKLPKQLLFNTIPFTPCNTASFVSSKSCSSSTKIGDATVLADGGPDVGVITGKAEMYFGTGFTVLVRLKTDKPAILDEAIIGSLRSSGSATDSNAAYGLEMYIPVPQIVRQPLTTVFPTVTSVEATVKPPVKSKSVKGLKGKTKIPLAGLGPCKGALAFAINNLYTDATNSVLTKTDSATASASCSK